MMPFLPALISSPRSTGRCGTVAFFYVPRGVAVALAVQALTAHMTDGGMEQSHVLLIADEHSQVTLVDERLSGSAELAGLHNGVVELYLKAGAHVHYLKCRTGAVASGALPTNGPSWRPIAICAGLWQRWGVVCTGPPQCPVTRARQQLETLWPDTD